MGYWISVAELLFAAVAINASVGEWFATARAVVDPVAGNSAVTTRPTCLFL
jgi:hypothetical protein